MKKKFVIIAVFLFLFSFFLTSSLADKLFGYTIVDNIASVFLWTLVLIPLSFFALVLNDQKHKIWLKFTGIFFVVSMVLVFITPEYGHGIVSIDRELVNWFTVGLYSLVSVVYFITQFFKNRKKI